MFHSSLTPHRDFYKGYWFRSTNSNWYFFYECPKEFMISTSDEFYKTLDYELVDIVKLLHSKNIATTPSCSGHSFNTDYYSALYNTIQKEYSHIRSTGLQLTNVENLEQTNYLDSNFYFPYSKEKFVDIMLVYGKVGILGLLGNFSYIKGIEGLEIEFDGIVTNFTVSKNNQYIWRHLYNEFNDIPKL